MTVEAISRSSQVRRAVVAWVPVLALGGLIALLATRPPRHEDAPSEDAPPQRVRAQAVEARTVRETATLSGRVSANLAATLATEKPGRVVECAVDKGDPVVQGQVLLRLDDRHWQAFERQVRLELQDAERDLERWEQMKVSGAVAASDYDAILKRRDLAAVALEQADVHLDQCRVVSPLDGVVELRWVEVGEYLPEGHAVFRVLSVDPMKILVRVPERDAASVRLGDRKRIVAPMLDSAAFEGRVTHVAGEASAASFTVAVELTAESAPPALRPGMLVEVELQRSMREGAIAVPLAAVIPSRGEHVVFVVEDDVAVRRVVGLEAVAGQEALLSFGLQAGEQLIVEGHRGLQDGVRVAVQGTDEDQAGAANGE